MIDIQKFSEAHGLGLFGSTGLHQESPTEEFVRFFLDKHASLDAEHLRCALLILSSVDDDRVRAIAKSYHDHPDAGVGHAAGVFFHRQIEHGYIKPMAWKEWIALS